ncbi:MAG: glutathione S-transferase N-terminal domain-containing protein [Sphingomonadales bacterium]|nr:glutathione S-transferase N-terminal domain-containing protein [Sphingomonadales bacterium]
MPRPQLFYFPTPNGKKVSIAIEEMGLACDIVPVNILQGEQQAPDFLAICPNGRIPALRDWTADGTPVDVFESGAILQYLGRKAAGPLYPLEEPQRSRVDSWLMWQMAGLGPMAGQLSYFLRVSNIPDRSEANYAYPIHRYRREVRRLYGVLEGRLAAHDWLCDAYSIADIACWTWVDQYRAQIGNFADFPGVARWHAAIAARPAVIRGCNVWHPDSDDGWSSRGNAAQIAAGSAGQAT